MLFIAVWLCDSSAAGNSNPQPHTTSTKRGCPNQIKTILNSLTIIECLSNLVRLVNQKIYLKDLELHVSPELRLNSLL
jgi:hypothetical protein